MKKVYTIIFSSLFLLSQTTAQLYINTDVYVQNGGVLFAQDTIQLANTAVVATQGIIQSAKGINTNGHFINTGTTGFIISPVANNVAKIFDIGTTLNNKIQLQHTTGSTVTYQMAVRDNVYNNPTINNIQIISKVVGKTWMVQPLTSSANTNATLYWDAATELTGFTRATSAVSKWITGTSLGWSIVGSYAAATTTGSTPAYSRAVSLGNLSTSNLFLGVGSTGSALPVEGLIFDAVANKTDVFINWKAIEVLNGKNFELERSIDGVNFTNIYTTNNVLLEDYNYTDSKAFFNTNSEVLFYRLKEIDNNGLYTFSDIKRVEANSANVNSISIYPNPAKSLFYIKLYSEKTSEASIILYDVTGKKVLNNTISLYKGLQNIPVNSSQLAKGIYEISIITGGKNITTQKIIIQ